MQTLRRHWPFFFAFAAFLGCVLACRPGFSPDGRRVLFHTVDDETHKTVVRVYDRKTEKVTTLRELPWRDSNAVYCATSWSPSGAQIGMVWTPTNLAIVDAKSDRTIRTASIPTEDGKGLLHPPAFTEQFLLFSGKKIQRLNLRDGKIDQELVEESEDIFVFNQQKDVRYYTVLKGSNTTGAIEFGKVDVQELKRIPEQTIPTPNLDGIPAISQDGKRIAIWKESAIEIWQLGKLEKTLPLGKTNSLMVGNLAWSKDEKFLFAPGFLEKEAPSSEVKAEILFLTIPTDGSTIDSIPLGKLKMQDNESALCSQIAFSPDGKTIALGTPFGSFDARGQKIALYLIDVNNAPRIIQRIAFDSKDAK